MDIVSLRREKNERFILGTKKVPILLLKFKTDHGMVVYMHLSMYNL